MVIIKKILLIICLLNAQISFGQSLTVNGKKIDLSKDYASNIEIMDQHVNAKFGSYEKLLQADPMTAEDQKILYYRNQQSVLLMQQGDGDQVNVELSRKIFSKADEFSNDELDFDTLFESFEKASKDLGNNKKKLKYFASASFLAWDYLLTGKTQDGTELKMTSKEQGGCYGGGAVYESQSWGLKSSLCYGLLKANVVDSTSTQYGPITVDSKAILVMVGGYWKPAQDLSIGFFPTYVYHNADYPVVSKGSISAKNKYTVGYLFGFGWRLLPQLELDINLGNNFGYNPSVLKMGLSYFIN